MDGGVYKHLLEKPKFRAEIITKAVPRVFMNPEAGPEIPGYQGENFGNAPEEADPEELEERDIDE